MRLLPRLLMAFATVALLPTAGLGLALRYERREDAMRRTPVDVQRACDIVAGELRDQADHDDKQLGSGCELAERVSFSRERGDDSARAGQKRLVTEFWKNWQNYPRDQVILAAQGGDIIGAEPATLYRTSNKEIDAMLALPPGYRLEDVNGTTFLTSRCIQGASKKVGLVGWREVDPLLTRFAGGLGLEGVEVKRSEPAPALSAGRLVRSCDFTDKSGKHMRLYASVPTSGLDSALANIDRTVLLAALASVGVALLLGTILARAIGRPISILADEAAKVANDQAQPLRVQGSGEVRELVVAFDKMLEDLAVTKRRLAATNRVAAWREVARRVAHEVKNPLAPIRAAVETLRRLFARKDPAFDEYFDEATRTVLDEVHRIANIVTEFTRFARLPAPRPTPVDLREVVTYVINANRAAAGDVPLEARVVRAPPIVQADRDQIVQVLQNLVQNAVDASKDSKAPVIIEVDGTPLHAIVTVRDLGSGITPEIAPRLFEPYATSKGANGTGLGLAIAQRIAIEHNGELAYVGKNGERGAVFRLLLPLEGPPPTSELTPSSG